MYDVTDFLAIHPGGAGVLAGLGGKDATDFFDELPTQNCDIVVMLAYKDLIVTAEDGSRRLIQTTTEYETAVDSVRILSILLLRWRSAVIIGPGGSISWKVPQEYGDLAIGLNALLIPVGHYVVNP